ncbi:hypothetical protein EDD16DRAFT_1548713 [Pisolithus croceorrhizus]|nr:hypothetical protein F5141DRAFT_1123640 [Pisolithus sp. B1]KAI6128457.1 hypothetical protein EDD16DRAFT_1548713 [Pisolithus croceorrhizus]KAI6165026.1 hypothetical protein EDD17DRAFT_1559327 [Pisolithus thermaeus]
MRLAATFTLLAFAAYVRAEQCVSCPCTVAGENLVFTCSAVNKEDEPETWCQYTANYDNAPFCVYYNIGGSMGFCDYGASDSDCPDYVGTTLGGCEIC